MYSLVAYIARYGFFALMVIILYRANHWIRYETSVKTIEKSMLPDAGFIGEWAVLHGAGKIEDGTILNAPGDGFLGGGRACDVRIPVKGLKKRIARFYFRPDGLHMLPFGGGEIVVDGRPVQQEAVLRHGAILTIDDIALQFRLFAGILLTGEAVIGAPVEADAAYRQESLLDPDAPSQGDAGMELPKPTLRVVGRRRKGGGGEKRASGV